METWLCCMITFVITGITVNDAAKWTYTGEKGASYWDQLFPQACSGKHQSPINIRPEETTYNPDLKDFAIWYDPPKPNSKMYIRNNGHTVQVDLQGDFYVTNGGLSQMYKALQFHYHWGGDGNEQLGSEHLIDGKASPIEMHLVTYNYELYSSVGEAVTSPGGLAVLGVMYEISDDDNPDLATVVKALKHVRDPDLHEKVELPLMSLRDFLPKDISRYYRYNGSLTTPGCFESVVWTVFDEKQTISLAQLREFRKLLQHKHAVKKSKNGHEVSRHHRSVRNIKRRNQPAVRDVLDELGIRGNKFEEAIFRYELTHRHKISDTQYNVVLRKKRDESEDHIEDEPANHEVSNEGHLGGEAANHEVSNEEHQGGDGIIHEGSNDGHQEGNDVNDDKNNEDDDTDHDKHNEDHTDDYKTVEEVVETEAEENVYLQENMFDNYRPVQPLNDRVVFRSFKLRARRVYADEPDEYRVGQSNDDDDDDNGATYQKLSLPAILTVLILTVVFV